MVLLWWRPRTPRLPVLGAPNCPLLTKRSCNACMTATCKQLQTVEGISMLIQEHWVDLAVVAGIGYWEQKRGGELSLIFLHLVYVEWQISLHKRYVYLKVPGDCTTEYLVIRSGTDNTGALIGKYCDSNPPPESLNTKAASIWINFVKTKDSSASFAATWTAETCNWFSYYLLIQNIYFSDLL